jgi:signal transduction histidine kinase
LTTLLVVDDRPADRDLAVTVLGYAGYHVLEASSGEAALAMARDDCPDLIITDILMPVMNGYEFVRRLRQDPDLRDVRVIFSTASYTEGEVRLLADACGVTRFLPKPCHPSLMVSVVGEVLGVERQIVAPLHAAHLEREERRLINDKLVQTINELEQVSAERHRLVGQLLQAHEDERRRIAEQLHDDSIQAIVAVGMRLETLARDLDDPSHRERVQGLQLTVRAAVDRLRAMIFALVPVELDTQGLAVALEILLEHRFPAGDVRATIDDRTTREAPPRTRTLLYRMAQEALTNVDKHAAASNVRVTLEERDGFFTVRITDDGRGFDPAQAIRPRPGHLGLASIHERATLAGGSLRLTSTSVGGSATTVEITLPAELGRSEELPD